MWHTVGIAGRDAVLAAQGGFSRQPGHYPSSSLVAIEEAEAAAQANDQTLQEYLGNMTIADLVEQFANEQNHSWLTVHDFFMGNNSRFPVMFVKCQNVDIPRHL